MVEDSIYSRLSTYTALTNLVGSNIWHGPIPTDSLPSQGQDWNAVVFSRMMNESDTNLDGSTAIIWEMFQFLSLSSESLRKARQIEAQVRKAMHGYKGGEILFSRVADGFSDAFDAALTEQHQSPLAFRISHLAA